MDPVAQLRLKLLPVLRTSQQQLQRRHADVRISVWDGHVGQLVDWHGYVARIDCVLTTADPDRPDTVALCVSLAHLDETPTIHDADVAWGHPSGHIEASLFPAPVPFSEETFGALLARLPELVAALDRALERGGPPPR